MSAPAVRRESQAELAGARQASQAELARTRDEAAAEQKRVVDAEVAKVRDEAERVLASSLADAQGAAVDAATSEARVTAERAVADEIAQAREEARRGQQAALAAVSRLLDSVRRLDAQPTLTDVLDTLTELVAAEAGRVAVFVASDGEMRGWRLCLRSSSPDGSIYFGRKSLETKVKPAADTPLATSLVRTASRDAFGASRPRLSYVYMYVYDIQKKASSAESVGRYPAT